MVDFIEMNNHAKSKVFCEVHISGSGPTVGGCVIGPVMNFNMPWAVIAKVKV